MSDLVEAKPSPVPAQCAWESTGFGAIYAAHSQAIYYLALRLLGDPTRLLVVEATGLGLGIMALIGCLILILRRANAPMLNKVTFWADWLALLLLLLQTASGIAVAITNSWGAQWYPATATQIGRASCRERV